MQTKITARSAVKDTIKSSYFLPRPSRAPHCLLSSSSSLIILRSTTRAYHLGYPFKSVLRRWRGIARAAGDAAVIGKKKAHRLTDWLTDWRVHTSILHAHAQQQLPVQCAWSARRRTRPYSRSPPSRGAASVVLRGARERVREDGRSRIFWSGSDRVYARPDRIC